MITIDQNIRSQFTEDIYKKAVEIYITSNEPIVLELNNAKIERKKSILHKLKGGANMLGFLEIVSLIDKAEMKLDNSKLISEINLSFLAIKSHFKC